MWYWSRAGASICMAMAVLEPLLKHLPAQATLGHGNVNAAK